MIKTFTQDDLIRYLYHETTEEVSREINRALLCDTELRKQFDELTEMKKGLKDAELNPSDKTVERILQYSRQLQAKQ